LIQVNDSFSLLTLNCFGAFMPGTRRRLRALAQEVENGAHQVVCLQEIQLHAYQRLFVQACPSYPYAMHEPYLHCPKGGLLTLSRLPILGKSFEPYEDRGLWYTPMLMDNLLYKGMLITHVTWNGLPIVIVNTHILANYMGDWERRGIYAQVEERQLQQLAQAVRSQPKDALVLVAGDFNVPRGSCLYHEFLSASGLSDPLAGDSRPTLRMPSGIPARYSLPIDYVLVRTPEMRSLKFDCDLCFSEKYPIDRWRQDYLSDHTGIRIRITQH
jgi:endonuclease/exonuclease/phosphatase family metal-dependent hydrolase